MLIKLPKQRLVGLKVLLEVNFGFGGEFSIKYFGEEYESYDWPGFPYKAKPDYPTLYHKNGPGCLSKNEFYFNDELINTNFLTEIVPMNESSTIKKDKLMKLERSVLLDANITGSDGEFEQYCVEKSIQNFVCLETGRFTNLLVGCPKTSLAGTYTSNIGNEDEQQVPVFDTDPTLYKGRKIARILDVNSASQYYDLDGNILPIPEIEEIMLWEKVTFEKYVSAIEKYKVFIIKNSETLPPRLDKVEEICNNAGIPYSTYSDDREFSGFDNNYVSGSPCYEDLKKFMEKGTS
jgi:hypothetical protein